MKSRVTKSVSHPKKGLREKAAVPAAPFPIVAIGASAGGLEAYTEFFHALPANTGMAFVLVQHLDPSHHSMLTEIIAKATKMPVEEIKSGVKARPGHVYVIPPNAFLTIAGNAFRLTPRRKGPAQHLAVNFFMRSLAEERKSSAIGIVFSGNWLAWHLWHGRHQGGRRNDLRPGADHGQVRWHAACGHRFRMRGFHSSAKGDCQRNSPGLNAILISSDGWRQESRKGSLPPRQLPDQVTGISTLSWTNCGRRAEWISASTSLVPFSGVHCGAW